MKSITKMVKSVELSGLISFFVCDMIWKTPSIKALIKKL